MREGMRDEKEAAQHTKMYKVCKPHAVVAHQKEGVCATRVTHCETEGSSFHLPLVSILKDTLSRLGSSAPGYKKRRDGISMGRTIAIRDDPPVQGSGIGIGSDH